jgi:hypothetical protein
MTGIMGFSFGLLGDFVKLALTDLKNYNAVKVKTEKRMTNTKSAELTYGIYKLGDKPSSFDFDFTLTEKAKKDGIRISRPPKIVKVSQSVLDLGVISEYQGYLIEDGVFSITFKDLHKYDEFRIIVNLFIPNETNLMEKLFTLNVKPKDPTVKALEAGFFDFLFKWPIYVTAIFMALILLGVIAVLLYIILVNLLKPKKSETYYEGLDY